MVARFLMILKNVFRASRPKTDAEIQRIQRLFGSKISFNSYQYGNLHINADGTDLKQITLSSWKNIIGRHISLK